MKNSISFFRFVKRLFFYLITGLLLLHSGSVFAASYTWDNGANTLLIQLATNESIIVSNAAGNTSFTLSSGVFTQSGGDAATGSGTGTITIADSDLTSSLTINNTSAGAGTNNVSLSGSGSLSSTTITINVAQTGTTAAISSSASFSLIGTTLTLRAATGVGTLVNPILGSVGSVTGFATTGDFCFKSSSTATLILGDITTNGTGTIDISHDGVLNINRTAIANNTGNATYTTTGPGDNIYYGGFGVTNAVGGTLTLNSGGSISADSHSDGDDIRAKFVVLNAVTGIGVTANSLEQSTSSITATNTTSGDIVLQINSNSSFSTTGVSAVNNASTGNIIVNRIGGTALNVTTATTVDGIITITTDGANLSLTGVSAGGMNNDVTASTTGTGNITVGSVSATGVVNLTAGGAIFDDGNAGTVVNAPAAALTASTGIATLVTPLNTDLDNLEATTATGGIFLSNTGTLTVGGVNGTLNGLKVTGASGAIQITASGTMTIGEPVQSPSNITLETTGSGSDLVLAHGATNGIQSTNGITTLESGHDILCGTAAGFGDASGQGTVLIAGNDIIIDAVTYVQANGMPGLSAMAGRDFKILRAVGGGSVFNNNAGNSPVTITTGAGGSFVLDQGSNGGVGANNGTIIINTNQLSVLSGAVTTTGTITLRPVTAGRAINLGTEAAGQLSLTDAELDQIIGGTLIIGSAVSGAITVSAGITRSATTNMQLLSAGDVSISGGGLNTNGGTLLLDPSTTPAAVKPIFNGTDVTASTLSFGSDLSFAINGTVPGNGTGATYTQLTVAGGVNLAGVDLLLTGTHVPVIGQAFTLVDNDGVDPIENTFTGLDEGSVINDFLGSNLKASITYLGGSGNDVVITVLAPPAFTLSPTNQAVCTGSGTTFTVTATNTASYQWQVDMGSGFTNLSNTPPYSNVTTPTLSISNVAGLNGYQYRAVATGAGGVTESGSATLTVDLLQTITLTSAPATENQTLCVNSPITSITYALGGGATGITPITGLPAGVTSSVTANILTISGSPTTVVGSPFNYSIATTGNTCPAASESGTITVNPQPAAPTLNTQTPNVVAVCFGTGVSATFNAGSGGVGCSDDFVLIIDNGTPMAYTPGSTVGTTANSSIVIQGRRANCSAGSGCSGSGYLTLASWNVNALPTAMISGATTVCQNSPSPSVTFTGANATASYTFTYKINGEPLQMASTSVGSNSVTVPVSTATAGEFTYTLLSVSESSSASCSQEQVGSVVVKVQGKPTITLSTLQQTLNEGNSQTFCDIDANPVNSLQFNVSGLCVVGSPLWRVQVGSGGWSAWSPNAPVSQSSNNQPHRYQAACDASCASTYSGVIELTINNRASVPQNVSLLVDGVTVLVGESKEVCSLVTIPLTFNANCAAGEVTLYSVDGGAYSSGVPTGLVDNQFHNYRVRCRKSDGTPSCVESESGVMRLKLVTIPTAPTVSLSSTSSCDATASFSGQSTCGSLRTVWYNASTNVALPNLPLTVPSATTSYYARCQTENGCVSEKSNVVTFTLTSTQVAPVVTASQEIVCTGTSVTISANCPAGSQTFWNTGVTTPSFEVSFNNVTKQTYWAKCLFAGGCQSAESVRKDIYWNAFVVTLINVGESKSSVKVNDRTAWSSQFIKRDGGPELEQSTQQNPTLYYVENANKVAPRYWTINVEACGLSTDGSLTFDMLATPEMGVVRSFNTHENNAPYFMYANRDGWTELYAQNHPAYGFYQDNGAGGNAYDAGLPKGLYKLGIRYWDQKGWGSIYPSTRKPQGNVLAYQEYWFRIQSKDGVGVGAAREMAEGEGQVVWDNGVFATVLPNPVLHTLRLKVQGSKAQVVQTTLTDASGREVLHRQFVPETNTHQEEFGVSELANGVYFLRVQTDHKQETLKVLKMK